MSLEFLQIFWYVILGVVLAFYTILDGFDLGVGALHLFAKGDTNRRIFLNAIGPVWDGNEVWLVVLIGGTFAGFPPFYASMLSGFYTLMMMFIFALMFRAAAIEFRSKMESKTWRNAWDTVFSLMSAYLAFSFGVVLGNLIQGIPIDQNGDFTGTIADFFTPYPILVGIASLTLLSMHGSVYLLMKTEGEIHDKIRNWFKPLMIAFILSFIVVTVATLYYRPYMAERMRMYPVLYLIPIITVAWIASIPYHINRNRDGWAFISSCLSIVFLFLLFGLGVYPYLMHSTLDPAYGLTLFNSSSSIITLKVIFIIVLIGVPLILAYGYWVYYIFRGKVKLNHMSY